MPVGLGREEGAQQEKIVRFPRATTCDWMLIVIHFWHVCTGSSINDFHNVQRLRDLGFEPLVLQGVHDMAPEASSLMKEEMANEPAPFQLGLAQDQ